MVRSELELGDHAPIPNMVDVLETCAIRVMELRTSLPIDGVAARRGDHFVIVLNPNVRGDRLRMNSAHELAHVLYDDCKNELCWSDNSVRKTHPRLRIVAAAANQPAKESVRRFIRFCGCSSTRKSSGSRCRRWSPA